MKVNTLLAGFTGLGLVNAVYELSFIRQNHNDQLNRFTKRNPVQTGFELEDSYYVAEISIGSERDIVKVAIDTTTSDLFVLSNKGCEPLMMDNDNNYMCEFGTFNSSSSNTFKRNESADAFKISNPLLGSNVSEGYWGYDVVRIGNTIINDLPFGIVNDSEAPIGVLGIGFPGLEVTNLPEYFFGSQKQNNDDYTYENVPIKFNLTGTIKTVAYSIYFTNVTGSSGSILFGGIDKAKFTGDLKSVDIVNTLQEEYPHIDKPIRLDFTVDSLSVDSYNDEEDLHEIESPFNTTISTLSTISSIPNEVLKKLAKELDLDQDDDGYKMECYLSDTRSVGFKMGDAIIHVPLSELVIRREDRTGCYFGIIGGSKNELVLGINFLRNAFVVPNYDDYTVSFAPVRFTNELDIHEITGSVTETSGVSDNNSRLNSNTPMEPQSIDDGSSQSSSISSSEPNEGDHNSSSGSPDSSSLAHDNDDDDSGNNSGDSNSLEDSSYHLIPSAINSILLILLWVV